MHKIDIPSPKAVKLQVCSLTSVSFRRHFLVCSRAEHVKLVLCISDFVSVELPLFRALCCLFWLRCSVSLLLQATGPAVVLLYSVGNIRTRHDVGVTENC